MVGGEFTQHHPGSYAAARWWQTLTEQATPSFSSSDSLCSEVRSVSQSERVTGDTTVRQDPRSYSTSVARCLAPFCAAARIAAIIRDPRRANVLTTHWAGYDPTWCFPYVIQWCPTKPLTGGDFSSVAKPL